VHRAHDAGQPELCELERTQRGGDGFEGHLPGGHRRGGRAALAAFEAKWNRKYPSIGALWRRNWQGIVPFFQFSPEIRKIVYTTNAIESLNMSLRKAIKIRGPFPSEDAALKVMYLALRNLAGKWHSVQNWREALNCFAMLWDNRFPATT
jgi:putative transposase